MKMGTLALMTGAAVIAITAGARAADKNDTIQPPLVLAQNVSSAAGAGGMSNAELAARVQALEDALAAQNDRAMTDRTRLSTLEQGYNSAVWNFDNGRATFASGDGRFTMAHPRPHAGRLCRLLAGCADSHPSGFAGPTDLSSGAVMRRAYFGIEGKAYNDFWYELRLNAGGSDGG